MEFKQDAVPTFFGTTAITFPWWGEAVSFFTGVNSTLIAMFGVAILAVTLWTKIVDLMIKRRQLKQMNLAIDPRAAAPHNNQEEG